MPVAVAPRAPPSSAYDRLRERLFVETDLDSLIALFARAIAEDAITGHYCIAAKAGGAIEPLFGDSPALIGSPERRQVIPAGSAVASNLLILFAIGSSIALSARVRGFATLYASRGSTLLEVDRDVQTGCPLSLMQRTIFARLLAGDAPVDIGLALALSTAAVQVHITRGVDALGAASPAEAVAYAARRGWLITTMKSFCFLSGRKVR